MTCPPDRDRLAVQAQLGRPPRGRWQVARRCGCGLPQVLQTHPRLDDGTPFPTLYWLSCRTLSVRIGGMESSGWMARFNARLDEEPELLAAMSAATQVYVRRRDALEVLGPTSHPGGGPERIKCLHAHAAHQLVLGGNPAGAAALEDLKWEDPDTPCI